MESSEEHVAEATPKEEKGDAIYPPPPSFYQNMQVPTERPPLPPMPPHSYVTPPPLPAPARPPAQVYAPRQHTVAPPYPPSFVVQPPPKRSRRWIWIVAAVMSVALLASCGLCGWGIYTIVGSTVQQFTGSLKVVNDYYGSLQTQNYAAAYQDDLALTNGLSQADFVQQAQARDEQYGIVSSYTPGQPSFRSDPNSPTGQDLSRASYAVDVSRKSLKYTVFLTLAQVKGRWVITSLDAI